MRTIRAVVFLVLVIFPYHMAGGHFHVLFQPYGLAMCIGVYSTFYFSMEGLYWPSSLKRERLWEIGRAALLPASLVPLALALIHATGFLDASNTTIGEHVASGIVSVVYGVWIFVAVFVVPDSKMRVPCRLVELALKALDCFMGAVLALGMAATCLYCVFWLR